MAGQTIFELPAPARERLMRAQVRSNMAPHGDPEPHSHAHSHDHDLHSDFTAEYKFVCDGPNKPTHLDVRLFDIFPGIEIISRF